MKKPLVLIALVLGLIFLGLAVFYWMTPAGSLPHSFPGYQAGSIHKHLKHGFAAFILAFGCAVVAWFSSGTKTA